MCKDELLVEHLTKSLNPKTGKYIPLRKWKGKEIPEDIKLRSINRDIKTRGKIKEVNKVELDSDKGCITKDWKFNWTPKQLKKKDEYLWGKVPSSKIGVYRFSQNNRPYSTSLRDRVKMKPVNLQGLGLLEGEMIRSENSKSGQYISFSNMEPQLVKIVIKCLDNIGISKSRIRAQPILNTKHEKEVGDQEIYDYWLSNLNLNEDNLVGIHRDSRYETEAEYGSVNIKIYDTIARSVLNQILLETKDTERSRFTKHFLRGLFAAEGSVNFSPQNRLNHISIGVKEKEVRSQYKEMLKTLDINPGGNVEPTPKEEAKEKDWKRASGGFFMIQGTENFRKISNTNLLELFPKKRLEMLIGLKNRKILPGDFRKEIEEGLEEMKLRHGKTYEKVNEKLIQPSERDREVLSLLRDLGQADRQRIAEELDIKPSSASRRMRSLYQKNLIERNQDGRKIIWTPIQDS
jgi:DNA-binding transcriptional ArsR family regulator